MKKRLLSMLLVLYLMVILLPVLAKVDNNGDSMDASRVSANQTYSTIQTDDIVKVNATVIPITDETLGNRMVVLLLLGFVTVVVIGSTIIYMGKKKDEIGE